MSVTSEYFIKFSTFVLVQTEDLEHLVNSSISVTSREPAFRDMQLDLYRENCT